MNTGNNQVYCQPGQPSNQPVALQCPAGGVLGYNASVADATTGYNLVTGLGSIDLNNLVTAWAAGRTASTTTVAASPTSVVLGQQVTLTATVTHATATGTVSFFNNGSTTALGTGTLSGGTATFQTTTLPVGTDNITATYGGDGYNAIVHNRDGSHGDGHCAGLHVDEQRRYAYRAGGTNVHGVPLHCHTDGVDDVWSSSDVWLFVLSHGPDAHFVQLYV